MTLYEELVKMSDAKYADFQVKLAPTVKRENCLGVRVPKVREFAKNFSKDPRREEFLDSLPHKYYDENMLHSILLTGERDFIRALERAEAFLPYIDNWATCDTLVPKGFAKNKEKLIERVKEWIKSDKEYVCRFAIITLIGFFLDKDFKKEYLDLVADVTNDAYYVKMARAWFFATALAKQWDETVSLIESRTLSPWIQNKSIQKAKESYRITDMQKKYLETLKV